MNLEKGRKRAGKRRKYNKQNEMEIQVKMEHRGHQRKHLLTYALPSNYPCMYELKVKD